MALRGAVNVCIGRQRNNPTFHSIHRFLRIQLHTSNSSASQGLIHIVSHPCAQAKPSYPVFAMQGLTTEATTSEKKQEGKSPQDWKIKMLYDGACPLCMREVDMLRERNKRYGTIKFVDISSDDYSPEENQRLDYKTVMGRIHAILADGTVVTDVEAFRKLYENVGLGWVYAITKYEPIGRLADAIYGVWAKYRLQITGRPPLEDILEARKKKGEVCNDNNKCKM